MMPQRRVLPTALERDVLAYGPLTERQIVVGWRYSRDPGKKIPRLPRNQILPLARY